MHCSGVGSSPAFYMPMPQQVPPPQMQDGSPNSKDGKTKISRSVPTVLKMPKCHQMEGLAKIDPSLDSTLTGKFDTEEIAVGIWILTRIKPNFTMADLCCDFYEEVIDKYVISAERLKDWSSPVGGWMEVEVYFFK